MINEMDILRMDERQRAAWLLANRATVIAVGLTWLGMIVWELAHDRQPLFLIVMVPVFALFRVALYLGYLRATPSAGRARLASGALRLIAALLLLVTAFLPLVTTQQGTQTGWRVALDGWDFALAMGLAFGWPWLLLLLGRVARRRRFALVVQFAAPLLAAVSTLTILWLPQPILNFDMTFAPWLWLPAEAKLEIGVQIAAAANGLYVVGWLVGLLGPSETGS